MNVTLQATDGQKLGAYVVGPEDATRSLVVLQEIFGVNKHMREVSDRFAEQGYRVVCPAIFDRAEVGVDLGYSPDDAQKGLAIRAQIPEEKTLLDIQASAAYLKNNGKIGIVGYCWGGTLAWMAATRLSEFSAASCWYGGGIAKLKDEAHKIPVQMHFGTLDKSIPANDVEAIRAAQPDVDIYIYEGADHGFGCDDRAAYQKEAAALAQERTLAFFAQHLA